MYISYYTNTCQQKHQVASVISQELLSDRQVMTEAVLPSLQTSTNLQRGPGHDGSVAAPKKPDTADSTDSPHHAWICDPVSRMAPSLSSLVPKMISEALSKLRSSAAFSGPASCGIPFNGMIGTVCLQSSFSFCLINKYRN